MVRRISANADRLPVIMNATTLFSSRNSSSTSVDWGSVRGFFLLLLLGMPNRNLTCRERECNMNYVWLRITWAKNIAVRHTDVSVELAQRY